jgi:ATP synthase protein I
MGVPEPVDRLAVRPPHIRHLLRWQAILTGLALLLAAPFGLAVLISAGVGALACLLAHTVMARLVFRRYSAQHPGALVLRIYGAEIVKITLILALFVIAFVAFDSLVLPVVLASYLAIQILPALIPQPGAGISQRNLTQS